ncbi:MAG: GumC family protein [Thermodesulfobacteriota bacterium]
MKVQTTGRILLHGLFRRWRLLAFISATILGTILLVSWLWPSQYQAQSSVVILSRAYPELLVPKGQPPGRMLTPKEELNSEVEIIRSRPVLEAVVRELHLERRKPLPETGVAGAIREVLRGVFRGVRWFLETIGLSKPLTPDQAFETAVEKLRTRLIVEPGSDSQVIWIRYRSPDPELAAQVVNRVAQEYQKQHLSININRAESSFYAEQIEKVQSELKGLQEQLLHLKEKAGIVSFSEQSRALLRKMETLDNSRTNVQKEIIRVRSRVEKIQDLRKAKPGLLIPLPELAQEMQLSALEDKYLNLQFQVKTVLQRYTKESRQYQVITEQIGALRKQIQDHVSTLLERDLAKLRELQAEEQAINQTIKDLKTEMDQLPAAEMNLANLERDIDTKQAIQSVLLKKYQDSLLAANTDQRLENAKILSLAAVPLKPVFPNLLLNLALGLVLALVVSLSVGFLLEYWDDSLKIPEDVERFLNRPVFASIPEL